MKEKIKKTAYIALSSIKRREKAMPIETAKSILGGISPRKEVRIDTNNNVCPNIDLQIVVPAYNVERYIGKCLETLAAQKTEYSYRVVVINDGSTDSTQSILEKYKKDERFHIIEQENRGFSGARNRGLETIEGRYVMFVDSDDFIPYTETIQRLVSCADRNKADIVACGHIKFVDEKEIATKQMSEIGERAIDPVSKLPGFPWGKIYSSKLFQDVSFPNDFWYEDTIIPWLVFTRSEKTYFCDFCGYAYRDNPNGISRSSKSKSRSVETWWITEAVIKRLDVMGIKITQSLYELFLNQVYINSYRLSLQSKEVRQAGFTIGVQLYNEYFKNFSVSDNEFKYKQIETALKEDNFSRMDLIYKYL